MSFDPPVLPDAGALYRVLAASAPDAILTIDETSTILAVNPAAERLFGYAAAEMIGQPMHLLMSPAMGARHAAGMGHYLATGIKRISWQRVRVPVRTKSGTEIPVEIAFGEFVADGRRLFSGFLRDVSEQVVHERALSEANAQLAEANAQLEEQAAELELQVEEAQALTEAVAQTNDALRLAADRADTARRTAEESERRFRRTADAAPVLIWTAGTDTLCDWFNQPWLEFTGRTMAQELGHGWAEGVHPDDFSRCLDVYLTAFRAREPFTMEYRLRRRDGQWRWLLDQGVPRLAADGAFAGYIGSCTDITDQKRADTILRASEARQRVLAEAGRVLSGSLEVGPALQALSELVIPALADYCHVDWVDPGTGEIRRVATAHVDPAKQRDLEAVSRRYPPNDTEGYATVMAIRTGTSRLLAEVPATYLHEVARDEGHRQLAEALAPQSFVVAPLMAGGRVTGAMILVMTPASGRHYGPDDLAMVEELARRVAVALDHARLYEASERARATAEAANRAKDLFFATMSHELRTPLNAIGGYTELLAMGLRGPVTTAQRDDLTRIQRSQQHLLTMINDVLDFARLESGTADLEVQAVSLDALFADVDVLIRPQVQAKGLTFIPCQPDPALHVRADRGRLLQILANLVGNSIKFTAAGGRIVVECAADGDVVRLRVTDTGIGIPADQLERIFECFTQVDQGLTRLAGGTGLGLAISRDLARAMGGELRAQSTLGAGATLTLTLRRAVAPEGAPDESLRHT